MSSKISALTAIVGSDVAAADLLPIVDTSATQTKKITWTEFLLGSRTSPTFTGVTTVAAGSAAAPSLAVGNAADGFYRSAANEISLSLAAAQAYLWATTAYVGVNLDLGTTTLKWGNIYVKRTLHAQGADVAAANNLVLGSDGNCFNITGATQINLLDRSNWLAGSEVTLLFASTPTVKHGQATSGDNTQILLAGAADFVASANDVLTLVLWSDNIWREKARTVI